MAVFVAIWEPAVVVVVPHEGFQGAAKAVLAQTRFISCGLEVDGFPPAELEVKSLISKKSV